MDFNRIKYHFDRLSLKPSVVLDIGACEGSWCREFKKIYPNALVHQFEANPNMRGKLSGVYDIVLLGDRCEKDIPYYRGGNDTGNSIYLEQSKYYTNHQTLLLPMYTLDNILENKYSQIDLIKLDTQGSELNILKGAKSTIDKTDLILLEVSFQQYNKDAPLAHEVFDYMDNIGFQAIDILEKHYYGDIFIQADVLFARKDSRYIISYFD